MHALVLSELRRCSIEKTPITLDGQPFGRLPDEIIEQILLASDPNGFASLVVLNRKWRDVSQRPHLYLHHLARCPSYVASPNGLPSADDENLPRLRRLFAGEIKRNLFESYLRPNETVVKLVSNSISSSSSLGGEGMHFAASPRGHHLLAYNSSRLYVIHVRGPGIEVRRELKLLRRPASACITDDAGLLAVLSSEMQVDLYDLTQSPPRRKQSMILDNNPRAIAMSSCGSVLAAAYDGGIEVSSLNPGALPTERRAVKCDAVDALAFSYDGTQILGTTLHSSPPSTVVITAPYYDPGALAIDENLSSMWTASILFPNSSRDCSHAVLLQDGSQEEASWAFAYDRSFETFRAVRIDDLRNGTTYFTGPVPKTTSQAKLLPCTPPSVTYRGELASAGFQGNEVWIYGVPEDLAAVPEAASSNSDNAPLPSGLARRNSAQSSSSRLSSTRAQDAAVAAATAGRVPQWQILCDKLRNNFTAGYKISEVTGVSNVKWVSGFGDTSFKERLVVTARGIKAPKLVTEEEDMDFVDGGRITLLDFDYALMNGTKSEITIEVGTNEAEVLEEEQRDIETEVAIVRRRTVAQKRGGGSNALLRAATTAAKGSAAPPSPDAEDDPLVPRTIGRNPVSTQPLLQEPADDEYVATIEEQEAMDAPYAHSSPRSGTTLRRAATAAAVDRRLNPRMADGRPIEYSRADGRREHPHESDADNWVPPPPPYQKEDPGDMPAFLRGPAVLPPISIPGVPMPPQVPIIQQPVPSTFPNPPNHAVSASSANVPAQGTEQGTSLDQKPSSSPHRTASNSSTASGLRVDELPPSQTRVSSAENLYDVSPPGSPRDTEHQFEYSRLPQPTVSPDFAAPLPEVNRPEVSFAIPNSSTERSGRIPATLPRVRNSYVSPSVPRLELQASSINLPNPESHSDSAQPARRLSNSQTWPLAPRPRGREAGSPSTVAAELATSLPPAPSPDQLERLNRRISQGNPRRLSGSLLTQHLHPRYQGGQRASGMHQPNPVSAATTTSMSHQEIDQPLIISTPSGVSGAFDPPGQGTFERGDAPILAPIPRRPGTGGDARSRPTVERLETIYSVRSDSNLAASAAAQAQEDRNFLPSWMRSVSPSRSFSMINRRPSRAEKNTQDAKKRESKSNRRRSKKADTEAASSAGWTDVSVVSDPKEDDKDKKCAVM